MELISAGSIATVAYELFKQGAQFTVAALRDKLVRYINDDVIADAVATEVKKLELHEGLSERAIEKEINNSQSLEKLINEINAKSISVAPATVTNVTQNHSGSGDNIGGNKIIN